MDTLLFVLALVVGLLALTRCIGWAADVPLVDPTLQPQTPMEYPEPPPIPTLVDAREGFLGYQEHDAAAAERMQGHIGRGTLNAILAEDLTIAYIDWELGNGEPTAGSSVRILEGPHAPIAQVDRAAVS